jgi:hypothetical protein
MNSLTMLINQSHQELYSKMASLIESEGHLDEEFFHTVLTLVFTRCGFEASEMSAGIGQSKSAVSKWINRKATPTAPSRKTANEWIVRRLRKEAQLFVAEPHTI